MNRHICKQKIQFMKKYKSKSQWDFCLISYRMIHTTKQSRRGKVWEKIVNPRRGQWNSWHWSKQHRESGSLTNCNLWTIGESEKVTIALENRIASHWKVRGYHKTQQVSLLEYTQNNKNNIPNKYLYTHDHCTIIIIVARKWKPSNCSWMDT